MSASLTKDDMVYMFMKFNDYKKIDEVLYSVESYVSENEYDIQVELILHTFRTMKQAYISDDFEKMCELAAPAFELLKTIDWDIFELHILATIIIYTPHHTISEDLKDEALELLNDEFYDNPESARIKSRLHLNLSMRHLRAKYYDGIDPQEINPLFDQCVNIAIPIYEKRGKTVLKTVILIRKAIFYGDCDKISEYLESFEKIKDNPLVEWTVKEDIVAFLHHLGDKITKPLLNFLIGYQIKKRRKELGMSTLDFADALGTNQTAVNGIERGFRGVSGPRLFKIAKILDVDIAYFYGDVNRKHTTTVTDVTTHKLMQIVSTLPEIDKEYILNHAKGFVQHKKASQSL